MTFQYLQNAIERAMWKGPALALATRQGDSAPLEGTGLQPSSAIGKLHDIYGPFTLAEPVNWPLILSVSAAAVALLLLGALWWRRRQRRTSNSSAPPPHTVALAEIDQARQLLEQGESLLYAEKVSTVLRRYIEQRFPLMATRQTTSEFLHSMEMLEGEEATILQQHRQQLHSCFELCDLAKYAHRSADREKLLELEERALEFITHTAEREEG